MGNKDRLSGKIQTVLGLIEPESLGLTLMHEHLSIDYAQMFGAPSAKSSKIKVGGLTVEQLQHLWEEPVSLQNIGHLRSYFHQNKDNLILNDVNTMCEEVTRFRARGGCSIVDLSVDGIHRNPTALRKISELTGANVIMGTGFYLSRLHPADMDHRTVEHLADKFISEIYEGVEGDICAGIIGELGCSTDLTKNEHNVLRAAAVAQKETGTTISIHPGLSVESPFHIVNVLRSEGADLSRVVMGHVDRGLLSVQNMLELAKMGVVLEFDQFGWGCTMSHSLLHGVDNPTDFTKCQMIRELRDYGFLKQVVISHDIAFKTRLVKYGGEGFEHIQKNVLPYMLTRGFTDEDINVMLVENPKRLLTVQ